MSRKIQGQKETEQKGNHSTLGHSGHKSAYRSRGSFIDIGCPQMERHHRQFEAHTDNEHSQADEYPD